MPSYNLSPKYLSLESFHRFLIVDLSSPWNVD